MFLARYLSKLDKESFLSLAFQGLNLLLPLLIARTLLNDSSETLIDYEKIISLVAFFSIVGDFGASQFFSSKTYTSRFLNKVYSTLFCFRLVNFCVSIIFIALLNFAFDQSFTLTVIASTLLLLSTSESAIAFLNKGKAYYFVLLSSVKFVVFLGLYFSGFELFVALVIAYVVSFTAFLFFSVQFKLQKPSLRVMTLFYKRYVNYFLSDLFTSLFTQLDSYLISATLSAEQSVIYIVCRKVIRAALSAINVIYKIIFVRADRGGVSLNNAVFFVVLYALGCFSLVNLFSEQIFSIITGKDIEFIPQVEVMRISMVILSSLLIFGVLKSIISNVYIFTNGLFSLHLKATIFSSLFFTVPLVFSELFGEVLDVVVISSLRLMTDIVYLLVIYSYYRLASNATFSRKSS
ncbi:MULTISPECIES: hypothetical protein [unclassified Pseudoalteromonas]|uniref:hypothetical protein n=1 Tax=unclassified Pseudoalteromonas TaxID=194690 RepID=UPI0020979A4F|nr:hypothetical protein [Pseudoalteromonas sp. XMcav2-N]MCO7188744.1 hypothetical protein [Pseudoalteromonas sp. XMcav2-N]